MVAQGPVWAQPCCQEACVLGVILSLCTPDQKPDPPALWALPDVVSGAVGGFLHTLSACWVLTHCSLWAAIGSAASATVLLPPSAPQTSPGGGRWPSRGSAGHQDPAQGQRKPHTTLPPGLAWAGLLESRGRGRRGAHHHRTAGVKSALGCGKGIAGPSEEGGRGCCTKQACVSPEWVALSWVLTHRTWALWNQARLPRPWTSPSGEAGGVASYWVRGQRPVLCPTQALPSC